MTTVALGPYEHRGAYIGSELFDVSGTPIMFCEWCEHSPCVAGGARWCGHNPRFIVVEAIEEEIRELARETLLVAPVSSKLTLALWAATRGLAQAAWSSDLAGEDALRHLTSVRILLREAKQEQS